MSAITAIDFTDPALRDNPIPIYERLRHEAPVFWNNGHWLTSRYDDIVTLLNDPRVSSARTDAHYAALPASVREELAPLHRVLSSRMLLTDPPTHTRLKSLVTPAFSAKMSNSRRARIQAICNRFADECLTAREVDVMARYATPLPSWVIAEILGVEPDDQPRFTRWSEAQVRIYDRPGTANDRVRIMREGQAAMLELRAYLEAIIEQRRRDPQDDLITQLVQAESEGDRLSGDELVVMVIAILIGGNNSTAHLIGNAVLTLARRPDATERLRADPELTRAAIEEVLRYESPVQATSRVAKEVIEIGGQTIQPGDNITVLLASANRDEAVFPSPDAFILDRHPNRHLTFAHGPHFCLGTSTARAITQTAIQTIIDRTRAIELLDDRIDWIPGFSFKGPKTLSIRMS